MRRSIISAALVLGLSGWGAVAHAGSVIFNAGYDIDSYYHYVIPTTGTYEITAFGAAGGNASELSFLGGSGAEVVGDFNLNAGDNLDILVGQIGESAVQEGVGGGGTFVYDANLSTLLDAAGGGGGAGYNDAGGAGLAGESGDAGTSFEYLNTQGAGGTGGAGGGAGDYNGDSGGGGGGGYLTDGGTAYGNDGGPSFLSYVAGIPGGFTGGTGYTGGGGGGGGYSGGGGGGYGGSGGGGGSYNSGLSDANFQVTGGVDTGNGEVVLNLIASGASVPEPTSVALLGIGLLSLGLIWRRRGNVVS